MGTNQIILFIVIGREVLEFKNLNWQDIVTPIKIDVFIQFLKEANNCCKEIEFLEKGFRNGFDIGYRGPCCRRDVLSNIPLRVGDGIKLWNKVMKEVRLKRYAGPFNFEELPLEQFVQSPIGLVPKSGNKTRLIFHLSFDFGEEYVKRSVNFHTLEELCSVKYEDLDKSVKNCLQLLVITNDPSQILYYAKSDFF